MAFWVVNNTAAPYTINDLGITLSTAEERDLHLSVVYEILQQSTDLATALATLNLSRLDGPGGSVIPAADAFNDATSPHQLGGAAHTETALAELNALLTDAVLDDSGDSRTPTSHASTHKGDGGDAIAVATATVSGLLSADDKGKLDDLSAGKLYLTCRNETGSDIPIGKLVAAAGWDPINGLPLIKIADKDTAGARPAIGYSETAIVNNTNGRIITSGLVASIDTSMWSVSTQLVLGNTGNFSLPPPGEDPFSGDVQNVAVVVTSHATEGIILLTPTGLPAITADQIFALLGSNGSPSKTNPYVTSSDPLLEHPENTFHVSPSGGDYTSIKTAVDAAITAGASASNPYSIVVYPGTYTEDPMTIQPGIVLSTETGNRSDSAFVVANNAAQDLFTCTGGYVAGLECSGVTDAAKAIFRMSTASTLTVLHGVAIKKCSTGIAISNGAKVVATDFSVNIDTVAIEVGTAISVTGANSYFGCVGGFFSVPAAVLPAYSVNPIQTVMRAADQAEVFVTGITARVANKDTTADVLLADGGSRTTVMASEISSCYRGARIGSSGTGTEVIVIGTAFFNNTINGQSDSATGVFLVNAATDASKLVAVPGTVLSGIMQLTDEDRTLLAGNLSYQFSATGQRLPLEEWFHDQTSTGVAGPDTTLVTAGTGLNVEVAAGEGYVSRHTPYHDSFYVTWDADTVAIAASTTNYIGYDSATSALVSTTSLPGASFILLATVVTDGSGIRFIHRTRELAHNTQAAFQSYLETTRKLLLKSGLAVVAGSTSVKFEVDSGEWYRSIDIILYTGTGTDASFSYFYGTNGVTEVASQTSVSTTQYDSSGTLTNMTASYYRSDTVLLTSDGRISVIYGTEEFATENLAVATNSGATPTFIDVTGIRLARLIVQQGNGITTIVDERPTGGVSASGGSGGVTVHADLAGLSANDHQQYLLTTGASAMGGDLNMDGNAISNVGNVDGVDVSAHASRHNPGGGDALTLGTPVATQVGASPAEGSASSFARSDHQHGIGSAVAASVGTANAEGTAATASRSDHVHAGLTRGDGDFNSFTPKVAPADADIFLIEDSAATFAKKELSFGNLEAEIDHTQIQNIGTNTHVQIDTHIGSTSNPHVVTKTQVSLGNVTDDAQLKRAANDFTSFANKGAPVGADILLIEDSDAAGAKSYISIASLPAPAPASTLVESSTTATTTSLTDILATGMTITPPAGTYLVWFTSSVSTTAANNSPTYASIYSGGVQVVASERRVSMKSGNDTAGVPCNAKVTVNGAQAIEGRWRVTGGTGAIYARTLSILKVS